MICENQFQIPSNLKFIQNKKERFAAQGAKVEGARVREGLCCQAGDGGAGAEARGGEGGATADQGCARGVQERDRVVQAGDRDVPDGARRVNSRGTREPRREGR